MNFGCRYIMKISYLGTNYSGWQIQNNSFTVQGSIMSCLKSILKFDIPLIVGAGRTDAGVHAVNFFAHFDYLNDLDCKDLLYRLNRFLNMDISVHYIMPTSSEFHARFSAISRSYDYWVSTLKDPFLISRSYQFFKSLDIQKMNEGAKLLIGTHDFRYFSKTKYDNSFCEVNSAVWIKSKGMLIFSINANRFLHNMVRAIVGALIDLGLSKITIDNFISILNGQNNCKFIRSVPACGLYLMNVDYPKKYNIETF